MSVIRSNVCRIYKYSRHIPSMYLATHRATLDPALPQTDSISHDSPPNPVNQSTNDTMSPSNPQPLRKTSAFLYLTTFILTLTTLSTTAAVRNPPILKPPNHHTN